MLGAGVVGAGSLVAWRVFGDSREAVPAPPERPRTWSYAMAGASGALSSLSVSGGSLYATADGPPSVHAVNAASGRGRWVAEVKAEAGLGPVAVVGSNLYVAAEGGQVNALAAGDGSRRWASGALGGGPPVAPVVIGSTVCVLMETEKVADNAGSTHTLVEGVLCGLDAASGRTKWRTGGNRLLLADRPRGQLVAESRDGDRVSVLDADTGDARWSLPRQDSVALGAKVMYATGAGKANEVVAYDLATGARLWRSPAPPRESGRSPGARVTVSDDGRTVYACEAGTGAVYAYDTATGDRRWRVTVDSPVTPEAASGGSAVFLATSDGFRGSRSSGGKEPDGYVTARAASDGKRLWRTTSDDCTSAPALVPGRSVLLAHGSHIWAYDARTGARLWRVAGRTGAARVPLVAGGRLYVVTDTGIGAVAV
ncbi:outer membrane protein assembly factor BamB family protein [Streptomyces sp. NBC_01257]|uniref:outer membrane protein assembly factor BamB family protein n=1 Tax=Streptomyces sp. NBC_01257 TaxID=2903799 RepID=UPI002DD94B8B|nr:PQQ-binding-like beta-propeller repeat protein [Streptomyces sp. NBC_01257]WRZ67571.1 PQQ-binding-like beta-propeller repeat protein [Streptomyces sp. NBC_01257]